MSLKKAFVICAAGLVVGSCHKPADAQSVCGNTDDVESFLKREYNEVALVEASHESGAIIQFFVSNDMKTGTFVIKRPDGISCIASEVTDIRPAKPSKPIGPTKDL